MAGQPQTEANSMHQNIFIFGIMKQPHDIIQQLHVPTIFNDILRIQK